MSVQEIYFEGIISGLLHILHSTRFAQSLNCFSFAICDDRSNMNISLLSTSNTLRKYSLACCK